MNKQTFPLLANEKKLLHSFSLPPLISLSLYAKIPPWPHGYCVWDKGGVRQKDEKLYEGRKCSACGETYWDWQPLLLHSFVRGEAKPSSKDREAWTVSSLVPPLPVLSSSESSQAYTFVEGPAGPPDFDAVLFWYFAVVLL